MEIIKMGRNAWLKMRANSRPRLILPAAVNASRNDCHLPGTLLSSSVRINKAIASGGLSLCFSRKVAVFSEKTSKESLKVVCLQTSLQNMS